jgi:hypothetical protein
MTPEQRFYQLRELNEERSLQRKLSLRLINIGYKALIANPPPDKGEYQTAVLRLKRIRKRLKMVAWPARATRRAIAATEEGSRQCAGIAKSGKGFRLTFARWVAAAHGGGNSRDAGLLRAARELGAEVVATTPTKTLKKMAKNMATHGTAIVVEGLRASDGSHVTKEDYALFSWAAGHVIAEWGDHSTQPERIQ